MDEQSVSIYIYAHSLQKAGTQGIQDIWL